LSVHEATQIRPSAAISGTPSFDAVPPDVSQVDESGAADFAA
jgi:hypothetical protein